MKKHLNEIVAFLSVSFDQIKIISGKISNLHLQQLKIEVFSQTVQAFLLNIN
jgi:hypothetical protein